MSSSRRNPHGLPEGSYDNPPAKCVWIPCRPSDMKAHVMEDGQIMRPVGKSSHENPWVEMAFWEIADEMGLSTMCVKKTYDRAMKKIAERISDGETLLEQYRGE